MKKSAGSKTNIPAHKKSASDNQSPDQRTKSEVEKMIKEGSTGEKKVSVKIGKTDLFNSLSFDGSKKISGQRAFAKKRSAMQHYITKK
ncbi:MAG: hypothetical protein IAE90_06815 [Ignavibacteria bacterium]|nr:hypothetical protein [Ignavibacteria bacterium]